MARDIWFSSDHHLGHASIIKFTRSDGSKLRDFNTIEEHDERILEAHNSVVKPQDKVYFLGDFFLNDRNMPSIRKFAGHKRLVRGNHDIFGTGLYLKNGIEEIYGIRVFTPRETGGVFFAATHVPVHVSNLYRWKVNVHGHTHSNVVMKDILIHQEDDTFVESVPDERYICVCMEHLDNYRPIHMDEIVARIKSLGLDKGGEY